MCVHMCACNSWTSTVMLFSVKSNAGPEMQADRCEGAGLTELGTLGQFSEQGRRSDKVFPSCGIASRRDRNAGERA